MALTGATPGLIFTLCAAVVVEGVVLLIITLGTDVSGTWKKYIINPTASIKCNPKIIAMYIGFCFPEKMINYILMNGVVFLNLQYFP